MNEVTTDISSEDDIHPTQKKKKKKKKIFKPKSKKKIALWSIVALLFGLWYWGTQPIYIIGTQFFGVCRTYIELNVQYPSELRFVDIRERGPDVAVEYITIDSFGQYIVHRGTCMFKREETGQIVMDYFYLRRGMSDREFIFAIEDPEKVRKFNLTVPFLLESEINLVIRGPARFLGDLTPTKK